MKFTKLKLTKRGSAIIYVIILMVPVIFGAAALLRMVSTDFTAGSSTIKGQQALYNAESGIEWGIKKLQLKNYSSSDMSMYNHDTVYIMDGAAGFDDSNNCFKAFISYLPASKRFTIASTGKYGGVTRKLTREINREGLLTLSRKFSCGELKVSEGRVYFQISPILMGGKNQDKFLITSRDEPSNTRIYSYIYGGAIDSAVKVDAENFFQLEDDRNNSLPDIKAPSTLRNQWISYTPELQYYITEKNTKVLIDKECLQSTEDNFFRGFRDYSGNYEAGVFNSNRVRVMLIDGDLVLKGIRGDFEASRLTFGERFLNNLVIYCTGKVTIEDCELRGYGGGTTADTDINLSIHSREMDFKSVEEDSIVNSLTGNASHIRANEQKIIEVIKANTTPYSNWSLGF